MLTRLRRPAAVGEHEGERRSLPLVGLAKRARFDETQEEVD